MDDATIKAYYNQCDPNRSLEAGDPRYEPFDEKRLRGKASPAKRLLERIELSDGPTTQLWSGLIGSGKSTELRQFAAAAQGKGYFVAAANVVDREIPYIDRSKRFEPGDVLFAACMSLDEALRRSSPPAVAASQDFLERLWNFLLTEIELEEWSLGKDGAEISGTLKTEPTFKQELNAKLQKSPLRVKKAVHDFIRESVAEVRQRGLGRDVVIILDGLEKSAETEIDRDDREAAFRDVFNLNSELLRIPCHVVYSIPLFLIVYQQQLGALYGTEPVVLPMVRIKKRTGGQDDDGVSAMLNALNRRVPVIDAFDDPEIARKFVMESGGFLRDLMRFIREALLICAEEGAGRISAEIGDRAVGEVRRTYKEALLQEYRQPLSQTRDTGQFPVADETLPLFGRLLRSHMLLRYHNGADYWYDAHPLLHDLL